MNPQKRESVESATYLPWASLVVAAAAAAAEN